jgi:putative ABC transport system substrate-binding protein
MAAASGQAAQVYRIGYVSSASPNEPGEKAFREGLREAGYVEGKNVIVQARFAKGDPERLPELVAGVVAQKVDVLVVSSTRTALAAKRATTTIPIVFASVFDPVAAGIVASLARPGGNITGSAIGVGEGFGGKWVELLKDAVPGVAHIAVLWNSANESSAQAAREIQAAARSLNVTLDMLDAGTPVSLDKAFAAIGGGRAQGLVVAPDPYFTANRAKIVRFAARKRLPAVYFFTAFVEAGGFMAYGPIHVESFRAAATYVDRILKGASPADLPVEQPTKFELVINRKTARALGLTISPSLLVRADRIID